MKHFPRYPRKAHASGRARIVVDGATVYLEGEHGSEQSWADYRRRKAEWEAGGATVPTVRGPLTVAELAIAFDLYAEVAYATSKERLAFRDLLKRVTALYGSTLARDFRAKALRAVQGELAKVWSGRVVNRQIVRLRTVFRWAESEELVPAGTWEHLRSVRGLRAGTPVVRPVPEGDLAATLVQLRPIPLAMVQVQLLTGMRPGELVRMRPCDLDRDKLPGVWVYVPGSDAGPLGEHKTAWRGIAKAILVGPQAQTWLAPFLERLPSTYCFCPCEATPAHLRKRRRSRNPGERYAVDGYAQAIEYACRRAGVETWTPGRLRKNAASRLASEFGVDVARAVLGHQDSAITRRHYIAPDLRAAAEAIRRVG